MLKPGDLVFTVGRGPVSALIQLATFSLPGRGYSHVMIVGSLHGRPILYESTSFERPPCVRSEKQIAGVQAHWPEDILDDPAVKVFHAPLRRELYRHEEDRLNHFLDCKIGQPYDFIGAGKSGGFILKFLSAFLRDEDMSTIFCSELAIAALNDIGLVQTRSASKFSPNSLYRAMRCRGLVDKAKRIFQPEIVKNVKR